MSKYVDDKQKDINRIIEANNIVLKMIRQSNHVLTKSNSVHFQQSGSGIEELSTSIDDFSGINDKLQNLLERMRGDIEEPGINKKITDVTREIKEIADVAVMLINFLGELIDLTQDKSLKKVQHQVADIVLSLDKYID